MATASYSSDTIGAAIHHAVKEAGLEKLKKEQDRVISEFVSGKDVFVSLPTGYGKSLCYALLPLVFDFLRDPSGKSIVICISPLTALMMDQREKLNSWGIPAEFVGEVQQDLEVMRDVKQGRIQLLYISPESLLRNPQWREMLLSTVYQENIVAVVIDEAHCVTQW